MGNAISNCHRCEREICSFDGWACRSCDSLGLSEGDTIMLLPQIGLSIAPGTPLIVISDDEGYLSCRDSNGNTVGFDGFQTSFKRVSSLEGLAGAAEASE